MQDAAARPTLRHAREPGDLAAVVVVAAGQTTEAGRAGEGSVCARAGSAALARSVVPHASIASPIFSFMAPPAAVSAVPYAPHCRAGDEETPDVFGRRREEIQVRKWRVASGDVRRS